MPKAYSYLRFSRPEQALGDSSRRQFEKAKKYADENGLDLDELTFHDEGVSAYRGKQMETGRLGDFLREVREGRVEQGSFLLVESLDRISRQSVRKALRVLEDICEEGITVVTIIDGRLYDKQTLDSDPMSLIMSLLTFFRAHEESETKATRLKDVWSNKRKNIGTVPLTARAPAWLRLNKEIRAFEVIEERAEVIRLIFKQYIEGVGPSGIVRQLNQQGLPTWGRGVIWNQSYVTKILSSSAVYGAYTPATADHVNGKVVRVPLDQIAGYFPVVVSEAVFLQAKELKECRGLKGRKITVALANSFSRLSRCPVCDSAMVYVNKGKAWLYLACSSAKQGAKLCSYRSVPYARLEDSFIEAVRAGLKLPVDRDKLDLIEAKLAKSEAQMGKSIRERSNILDAVKAGAFKEDMVTEAFFPKNVLTSIIEEGPVYHEIWGPRTLREEIEMLDELIERDRKHIAKLRGQINLLRPAAVDARLKELEAAAREHVLDRVRFNAALRTLCNKIVIQYDHAAIDLHLKHTESVLRVPVLI